MLIKLQPSPDPGCTLRFTALPKLTCLAIQGIVQSVNTILTGHCLLPAVTLCPVKLFHFSQNNQNYGILRLLVFWYFFYYWYLLVLNSVIQGTQL